MNQKLKIVLDTATRLVRPARDNERRTGDSRHVCPKIVERDHAVAMFLPGTMKEIGKYRDMDGLVTPVRVTLLPNPGPAIGDVAAVG